MAYTFFITINVIAFFVIFLLSRKLLKLRKRVRQEKGKRRNNGTKKAGEETISDGFPSDIFRDDFHSGRFHFESNVQDDTIINIKYALAKNDQDSLYKYLKKIDGADDVVKIKTKKISKDLITIGFFCSYTNSGIFKHTIGSYNNLSDKIKWVGCNIRSSELIADASCPIISFPNVKSAIEYSDAHFDFVVDADSFLRPDNFYEVIKNTSSYTLNYFNLSCSSYNNHLDAG